MQASRIKLLPDHVANQIAAGEVVQRPASVVKELMENALDAKADEVRLIVKDGGKALIQVIDNGIGMNEIDARMSFERHATSKIADAKDLFHINTKGFRGEALASIAAVAHVELKTKQENTELGTLIKIEGSKIVVQEPVATQKGTSISVKNLFFNIPARRKFLKSIQVEMRHINDEFLRLALAHPDIAFKLVHNGNVVYQLPKSNLLQRINNIFGAKIKEKLVPVSEETEYIKIYGFIGKPEFAKRKRGEQFFFVNHRFIKSPYLNHALNAAYEGLIKEKSYPSYFVYFDINPEHIDVNIHPTKTEIKFDDEPTVYSILKVAAKHSLGQFNLSPSMDFQAKPDLDVPYEYTKKTPVTPKINVNPDFNPFEEDMFAQKNKFSSKYYEKQLDKWEALHHETIEMASKLDANQSGDNKAVQTELHSQINQFAAPAFQFNNKYIISYQADKLLVIHQNRAHQLVLFEEMMKQLKHGTINAQQLIFPVELQLQPDEINLLKQQDDFLHRLGYEVSFSGNTILINAVPLQQKTADTTAIFQEIIRNLSLDVPLNEEAMLEMFAKIISEKMAVKTGQKLMQEEVNALLTDLFSLKTQMFSPKGKRIFISLEAQDFDNKLN
jgi:DNA mismatch repair protein MutL